MRTNIELSHISGLVKVKLIYITNRAATVQLEVNYSSHMVRLRVSRSTRIGRYMFFCRKNTMKLWSELPLFSTPFFLLNNSPTVSLYTNTTALFQMLVVSKQFFYLVFSKMLDFRILPISSVFH